MHCNGVLFYSAHFCEMLEVNILNRRKSEFLSVTVRFCVYVVKMHFKLHTFGGVFFSFQATYVIHIFPPCEFSSTNLGRFAQDIVQNTADSNYLLIVITTC